MENIYQIYYRKGYLSDGSTSRKSQGDFSSNTAPDNFNSIPNSIPGISRQYGFQPAIRTRWTNPRIPTPSMFLNIPQDPLNMKGARHTDPTKIAKTQVKKASFHCRFCGKEFNYNSNKLRHERIHTQDRRFACRYCLKPFFRNSHRLDHERIHIRDGAPAPVGFDQIK